MIGCKHVFTVKVDPNNQVFTVKVDPNDSMAQLKARHVVKGMKDMLKPMK